MDGSHPDRTIRSVQNRIFVLEYRVMSSKQAVLRIIFILAAVPAVLNAAYVIASAAVLRDVGVPAVFAASLGLSRSVPERPAEMPMVKPKTYKAGLASPLTDARYRVTKKPFGMEVHPETSPVPNDRFNGYHVGVDFETFDYEQESVVPVVAVCRGPLLFKKMAKGYGGVAVQSCVIDGQDVSVIYGHVRLDSVVPRQGDLIEAGERIAELGHGYSEETDGVRKHLHLGIHVGPPSDMDIHGYVKDEAETKRFLDALRYMEE